jgi:hypothetical protein
MQFMVLILRKTPKLKEVSSFQASKSSDNYQQAGQC